MSWSHVYHIHLIYRTWAGAFKNVVCGDGHNVASAQHLLDEAPIGARTGEPSYAKGGFPVEHWVGRWLCIYLNESPKGALDGPNLTDELQVCSSVAT